MLERLSEISADRSSEGRRELLNAVTDLFLVDNPQSEKATDHYAEIANRSLDVMNDAHRADYAGRVAAEATLPNAVAKRLATDESAEVAQLVLRLSPVLTDADLAAIAASHSQEHLAAIAERVSLSETVTDILVERGDKQVLRTVSGNDGAAFSDDGLDTLIKRGGSDHEVTDNLSRRADSLPAEHARRVLQIAAQMSVSGGGPDHVTEKISGDQPASLARMARERRLEIRLLIADLKEGKRQLDDVIVTLAQDDRAFDIAQVLSTFSDIPNTQALRALLQKDASGVAVACRAIGIGPAAFGSVLELRASRLGLTPKQVRRDLAEYENMAVEISERALRFLKFRNKVA
ncbi:MAG: DUF2336 domain-containing protein [Salinarimonadaceae bacterium]|nr:MAG: DUF2336 domain-containing protein [Salinarimonadaceae bacterium]